MSEIKPKSKRGGKREGAGRRPKAKPTGKPLENARHEAFARAVAEGTPQGEAYEGAGYKAHDGNASRLSNNEKIKARVDELKSLVVASVIARSAASKEYVIEALVDTLERCRQASPVLDRKGAIVMVETPDGDTAPAYIFDSKAVLRSAELLGKELGMFKDRVEHTGANGGPIETADVSPRDMAQRAAYLLNRGLMASAAKPN